MTWANSNPSYLHGAQLCGYPCSTKSRDNEFSRPSTFDSLPEFDYIDKKYSEYLAHDRITGSSAAIAYKVSITVQLELWITGSLRAA